MGVLVEEAEAVVRPVLVMTNMKGGQDRVLMLCLKEIARYGRSLCVRNG